MPSSPPLAYVPAPARSSVSVIKRRVVGAQILPAEEDLLAIEDPLEITLADADGGHSRLVIMRTPGTDEDLIYGHLFSEGVIDNPDDIAALEFAKAHTPSPPARVRVQLRPGLNAAMPQRTGAVQASCGVCGVDSLRGLALDPSLRFADRLRIDASLIHELPGRMRAEQATFETTGGLHAAALFSPQGALLTAREDIGRHNALDKAIGALLREQCRMAETILCVSGRMSYEILQKALRARIPIIAGVGAPSSLAVSLANDFNVTLIGFVRDRGYNIYSNPERLISPHV